MLAMVDTLVMTEASSRDRRAARTGDGGWLLVRRRGILAAGSIR